MWESETVDRVTSCLIAFLVSSCASGEIEPVPLYEEDACSFCRMAISEPQFASEIVSTASEVYKFDDLGCLRAFRGGRTDVVPAAMFVIDYDSRTWLHYDDAVVARTGIRTPMASGLVAIASPERAASLIEDNPPEDE